MEDFKVFFIKNKRCCPPCSLMGDSIFMFRWGRGLNAFRFLQMTAEGLYGSGICGPGVINGLFQ